jgi:hypothetical protein
MKLTAKKVLEMISIPTITLIESLNKIDKIWNKWK